MNMKRATTVLLAAMLLPGVAMAQIDTRATFSVTKNFADGNDVAEVTISLDCTSGQILDQDKILGDNDTVEFIVTAFTDGTPNCFIVEGDVTDGYSAEYDGNGDSSDCTWTAVANGDANNCTVTNTPDVVEIVVTKDWVLTGDNNDVDLGYDLKASCTNVFRDRSESGGAEDTAGKGGYKKIGRDGSAGPASNDHTFTFRPGFPSSTCKVDERVYDSAIEVDDSDCQGLVISAGEDSACTITNTVFFEGIPTLSQYGMAIMALLMLGVGFVGFRRFV
jgi:hypothetical protein